MKRLNTVGVLFVGVVMWAGLALAQSSDGEKPPIQEVTASAEGAAVAAAVQAFYEQTRGVTARFQQSYYYKLYDRYDRSGGEVTFLKPGRMRFRYEQPNGKTITSNGEHLWLYEPAAEGDTAQCIEQEIGDHQLPRAFSFLTGQGKLADDFSFRLLDASRFHYTQGYVLELRPKTESPHYDRILFYVPRQDNRPSGVVRRVLIVDPHGNRNRFDFSNMQWNPTVQPSEFDFSPPSGVQCTRP